MQFTDGLGHSHDRRKGSMTVNVWGGITQAWANLACRLVSVGAEILGVQVAGSAGPQASV